MDRRETESAAVNAAVENKVIKLRFKHLKLITHCKGTNKNILAATPGTWRLGEPGSTGAEQVSLPSLP